MNILNLGHTITTQEAEVQVGQMKQDKVCASDGVTPGTFPLLAAQ